MKIQYTRTFSKHGVPVGYPDEDRFFACEDMAVVADGITRDSIGCSNLSQFTAEEIYRNYPNPSPAAMAAEEVCFAFAEKRCFSPVAVMRLANNYVEKLNERLGIECDYLEHDYAACVAAAASIKNGLLLYSYICDCGIAVWDKKGNIKFKTTDDKMMVDPYLALELVGKTAWNLPAGRVLTRKEFRNNIKNPYSYGALTGEKSAAYFIRSGVFRLEQTDTVAVFSDGFTPYFERKDFFANIRNLDNYVKELEGKPGLGSEKTIIIIKP